MKKKLFTVVSVLGGILITTMDLGAKSFLAKISSAVLIFSILGGASVWVYALKKRREYEE